VKFNYAIVLATSHLGLQHYADYSTT